MGGGVRDRRRALLTELQHAPTVVGAVRASVLEVEVAGVRRGPAPRVDAHQLGVGVEGDRQRAGLWRGEREPDQRRSRAVRDEVGAFDGDLVDLLERGAGIPPTGGGPGSGGPLRVTQPLVGEPEPDAVDELDRRGPHAAHLTADVPAGGGVERVRGAHGVGAVSDDQGAAVRESRSLAQLGGGGQCPRGRRGFACSVATRQCDRGDGGGDGDEGGLERACGASHCVLPKRPV